MFLLSSRWSLPVLLLCTVSWSLKLVASSLESKRASDKTGSNVLEQLWEKLSQHLQQHAHSVLDDDDDDNDGELSTTIESNSLTAPHIATRGGPGVSNRRRALFEHGLYQHYQAMNATPSLQAVLDTYIYHQGEEQQQHHHPPPDRSKSLHHAFPPMPPSKLRANLQVLRDMFSHAYDSYMIHAWPAGEVKPISCQPGTFDLIKLKGLTVIDTLDTLFVMGNYTEFVRAIERLRVLNAKESLFHVDENVSLFETTIRVLGGLLSAHQMIMAYMMPSENNRSKESRIVVPEADVFTEGGDVRWGYNEPQDPALSTCRNIPEGLGLRTTGDEMCQQLEVEECSARNTPRHNHTRYWTYDNFLLELAEDLGQRLLPAFATRTGIPYGTVNLITGVPDGETTVASLAGGGTLTIEFELLSRLTGKSRYGKAAKLASRALWIRRSKTRDLNLFGKHIDVQSGHWTETLSGIGSNSDSFLEYLTKHYMLFPEDEDFWVMFVAAYTGVYENSRLGEWYVDTDMNAGARGGKSKHVLESLMAFYPGMQVLLGELAPAARSLNSFFIVRELLGFLPERFNFGNWNIDSGRGHASLHPLRPELLESCYFMHRATAGMKAETNETSGWQWAADFAIHKLHSVTRTKCGYSGVHHLNSHTTGTVDGTVNESSIRYMNEMPSFFLSETVKYLYLTFDDDNVLHKDRDLQWIFTTEAHPVHYVPPASKHGQEPEEKFSRDIDTLKSLLRDRIDGESPTAKVKNTLRSEKWADQTTFSGYTRDISTFTGKMKNQKEKHESRSDFFGNRQILGSFVAQVTMDSFNDTVPAHNFAHSAFKNTGVGSGKLLRKACPNVYSSELLWMHGLNGGATDYSDAYVSVTSDNLSDHPILFVALGAADALGTLGTGMYLGQVDTDECCQVPGSEEEKPKAEPSAKTDDGKPTGPGSDVSQFEVTTFADGGGFVVGHLPTGDKVIASFVFDERAAGKVYAMVYAGYSLGATSAASSSKIAGAGALWSMAGGQRTAFAYGKDGVNTKPSFWRKVVMADFEGNSFSCEVELYRRDLDDYSAQDGEVLATVPCAPGLFGRTHISHLREGDGIVVDADIILPREGDELGCSEKDEEPLDAEHNETLEFSHGDIVVVQGLDDNENADNGPTPQANAGSIQVVHRGECTFFSKAVNMKTEWGAEAVIVINTENDELFVMSHGDPNDALEDIEPDEIPLTVLVTGLDGEDLLSIANGEVADGGQVAARVSVKRQLTDLSPGGKVSAINNKHRWPIVRGGSQALQILAKGGWGVQAVQQNTKGSLDWNLLLLQYQETN